MTANAFGLVLTLLLAEEIASKLGQLVIDEVLLVFALLVTANTCQVLG